MSVLLPEISLSSLSFTFHFCSSTFGSTVFLWLLFHKRQQLLQTLPASIFLNLNGLSKQNTVHHHHHHHRRRRHFTGPGRPTIHPFEQEEQDTNTETNLQTGRKSPFRQSQTSQRPIHHHNRSVLSASSTSINAVE